MAHEVPRQEVAFLSEHGVLTSPSTQGCSMVWAPENLDFCVGLIGWKCIALTHELDRRYKV